VQGIATNSDAKLNAIERFEKKISVLKAERSNIENRLMSILDEALIYEKKGKELENETKIPEIPIKVLPSTFSKKVLAKTENDIKMLKHGADIGKLQIDINKINVNIDKANIELIKAEIKAGKTPKIPLELANAALKVTKSSLKSLEAGNKHTQARLKENEAKIKYLEAAIKTQEEREKSTTNDLYIRAIELAELELTEIMSRLNFEKVRGEAVQAHIKDVEACAKHFCKPTAELRKIYLKFDKVVDKKNFVSFLKHD
jgi:chromosome segregation ATPase